MHPFQPDLILFDIDGTLVRRAGPHHRLALVEAIRQVTGRESTTDGIPVHGMLDPDILTLMLRAQNYSAAEIATFMPALIRAAEDVYLNTAPDIRDKQCPGVFDLLEQLTSNNIPLALVTGNFTRIGWHKLKQAGLDGYFRFGAFGEMAPTRGGLAKLAIERARAEGLIRPDALIAQVGDAPQDVQSAQENGIVSIAVRTGITPPGELEALQPDYLLDDLTCWPASHAPSTVAAAD